MCSSGYVPGSVWVCVCVCACVCVYLSVCLITWQMTWHDKLGFTHTKWGKKLVILIFLIALLWNVIESFTENTNEFHLTFFNSSWSFFNAFQDISPRLASNFSRCVILFHVLSNVFSVVLWIVRLKRLCHTKQSSTWEEISLFWKPLWSSSISQEHGEDHRCQLVLLASAFSYSV